MLMWGRLSIHLYPLKSCLREGPNLWNIVHLIMEEPSYLSLNSRKERTLLLLCSATVFKLEHPTLSGKHNEGKKGGMFQIEDSLYIPPPLISWRLDHPPLALQME